MPPISIVIITLNEEKRIARLLDDLCQQTSQNFEVIVVDSNSSDNTLNVAAGYVSTLPSLTLHRMDTKGVSLGRNTGAGLARHERILFLDADVRLPDNFLENAQCQLSDKKLEVAGVYMGSDELALRHRIAYGAFNIGLALTQYVFPTAVGACIFSSREIHNKIGGFDEDIILCEDCHYVKKASKITRFRYLNMTFSFDPRRLEQDGMFSTGWIYLKANIRRFFCGEMRNNEIEYKFGHYN